MGFFVESVDLLKAFPFRFVLGVTGEIGADRQPFDPVDEARIRAEPSGVVVFPAPLNRHDADPGLMDFGEPDVFAVIEPIGLRGFEFAHVAVDRSVHKAFVPFDLAVEITGGPGGEGLPFAFLIVAVPEVAQSIGPAMAHVGIEATEIGEIGIVAVIGSDVADLKIQEIPIIL